MEPDGDIPVIRICVLGDSGVGKSSFALQCAEKTFSQDLKPTVGIDLKSIQYKSKKSTFKVEFWDPSGKER